jgi:hypothetical protein
LSILPFGTELRRILDVLCCLQINVPDVPDSTVPGGTVPGTPTTPGPAGPLSDMGAAADTGDSATTPSSPAYQRAFKRLNPVSENRDRLQAATQIAQAAFARGTAPFDPQKFLESAFLAEKDKSQGHFAAAEIDNLPQFLALNQLLRPIALGLLPANAGSIFSRMGLRVEGVEATSPEPDLESLRKQMEDLRADVARQAEEIKRLKQPRRNKG